jgi:hypothetical protein
VRLRNALAGATINKRREIRYSPLLLQPSDARTERHF